MAGPNTEVAMLLYVTYIYTYQSEGLPLWSQLLWLESWENQAYPQSSLYQEPGTLALWSLLHKPSWMLHQEQSLCVECIAYRVIMEGFGGGIILGGWVGGHYLGNGHSFAPLFNHFSQFFSLSLIHYTYIHTYISYITHWDLEVSLNMEVTLLWRSSNTLKY